MMTRVWYGRLNTVKPWFFWARTSAQPKNIPTSRPRSVPCGAVITDSQRMVLRGLERGLVFFSDCESDKGAELAANPRAAAVLHWLVPVHRQVRVAGTAQRVSEDEADEYWGTRAPAVRLSAAASRQSRVAGSRSVLEAQVRDILARHPGRRQPGGASSCGAKTLVAERPRVSHGGVLA